MLLTECSSYDMIKWMAGTTLRIWLHLARNRITQKDSITI